MGDGEPGRRRPAEHEVTRDLQAWRRTHPNATFSELEAVVNARLDRLRAELLTDLAHASPAAEHPGCPSCGAVMVPRGTRTRRLTVPGEQTVTLERRYWVCPACGAGLFPPG